MQQAELDKLLALTAVRLAPGQESVFLEYFTGMKQMFDEFYDTPFEGDFEHNTTKEGQCEEQYIQCFTGGEAFTGTETMLANVDTKRLVSNAIEVKSALGD